MAKMAVRASSNLSGRRMKVTEKSTPTPKGPTADGKEEGLGARLGSSTPQSPFKPKSMDSIGQPSPQPWTELPATEPQRTDGVTDLRYDKVGNNRPKESPAKDGMDGNNQSRPTAKRRRKEDLSQDIESIATIRKKRKVDVASAMDAEVATHHGAGSTLSNARPELKGTHLLSNEEGTRLVPRSRHNHHLNEAAVVNIVTETSIDILSTPADTNTSPHTPSRPDLFCVDRVGEKQISMSMSDPERTEISLPVAVEEPVITNTTPALQGDQILHLGQFPQGTPPTGEGKKCLALRFFDSQLDRRRDDGEAEKTRLLDAISWLTDLALDANKAEVGTEGITSSQEMVGILLSFGMPLICSPVCRGPGYKIRREDSGNSLAKGTVRGGPYHFRRSLT
jgi:hypothetical protein